MWNQSWTKSGEIQIADSFVYLSKHPAGSQIRLRFKKLIKNEKPVESQWSYDDIINSPYSEATD